MKRPTVLLTAMLSVAPVALLAATAATDAPAPTQRAERGWFKQLDANGDGVITKEEAQSSANARVEKTFADLDANHDGQITQDEIKAAHDERRAAMEAKFEARFKEADKNGDGLLSKEEVTAGMPRLTRGFDRLDTNKDGQLSADELKAGRTAMGRGKGPHRWKGPPPTDGSQPDTTQAPALR